MTTDSKAVCGGNWAGFSADEIVRRTRCEADDRSAPYTSNTWRTCCDLILARLKAAEPAALASTAGAGAGDWVTVPRRATPEMIHVMRYGEQSAKRIAIGQKPEIGETPWPRFGEPLAQEAYQAALAAAPAIPASPIKGGGTPTWPASYQETFDAIAAAVTVHDGTTFGISVKAFYRALAYPETAAPPAPAEHGVEIREAAQAVLTWFEQQAGMYDLCLEMGRLRAALSQGGGAGRSEKGEEEGRVPAAPGSREPSPSVSASGFDPSRTDQALYLSDGDDIWPPVRTVAYVQQELHRIAQDLNTVGEDLTDEQPKAISWLDVAYGRVHNCISVLKGVEQRLRTPAQAIEAHRAETLSGSVEDESAVHAVDAPGPSQDAPAQSPSTSDAEG